MQEPEQTSDQQAVLEGNTAFALALYDQLRTTPGNLFFSPLSISMTLAMLYAGAREKTAEQIARTLGFSLPPAELLAAFGRLDATLQKIKEEGPITIRSANALWPQDGYPLRAPDRRPNQESRQPGRSLSNDAVDPRQRNLLQGDLGHEIRPGSDARGALLG